VHLLLPSLGLSLGLCAPLSTEGSGHLSAQLARDSQEAVPRAWAWPGTSFGPRFTEGGVGLASLGFSYRLHENLEPEAFLGLGAHASLVPALAGGGFEIIDRFSFGTRLVFPVGDDVEEARPFLWLAIHHEHQAPWAAVLENPIGTTLGVSARGVAHYTGAEAGMGIALPFRVDRTLVQAMLRINVVYLPGWGGRVGDALLRDQVAVLADLAAGLPLTF
jgi:hypothetical protein